ncbi:XPG/Rad2 endonuclease [Abortiporus biennis]
MGVPGLWEILSPAGKSRAFSHIAVADGFEDNSSGKRAYRIGIDASIWFEHSRDSREGPNPQLRLLFFRLCRLAELPLLPLFVFDGRQRPNQKRGSRKGKSGSHYLTAEFKKLIEVFGMEHRTALGEAKAKLAYLNRKGYIDAILTDDVDAFVFGARTIIKNTGTGLSGNKSKPALNMDGKPSKSHTMIYNAAEIESNPQIGMNRADLVFFALLSGGDYDNGVPGCGPKIAYGLIKCGFGTQLFSGFERRDHRDLGSFLNRWRAEVNEELRTNSRGHLPKHNSVQLPALFPRTDILEWYFTPYCSESTGSTGGGSVHGNGILSLPRIAKLCEDKFDEWGYRSRIIHRFRTLMWGGALMSVLRHAAVEADEKERTRRSERGGRVTAIRGPLTPSIEDEVGTTASVVSKYLNPSASDRIASGFENRTTQQVPSAPVRDKNPLIKSIVGNRQHVSTDKLLEFRVEVDPAQFVALANSGITGKHREPTKNAIGLTDDDLDATLLGSQFAEKESKGKATDPLAVMRVWLPASMMRQVHPRLIQEYEMGVQAKHAAKGRDGAKSTNPNVNGDRESQPSSGSARVKTKQPKRMQHSVNSETPRASSSHSVPSLSQQHSHPPFIDSEFSLPLPRSRFIFSFPDPDNPDFVHLDNSGDETLEAPVSTPSCPQSQVGGVSAQNSTNSSLSHDRSLGSKSATTEMAQRSIPRNQRASGSERSNKPTVHIDEDEAPQNRFEQMIDDILGVGDGSTKIRKKRKAPAGKRNRIPGPDLRDAHDDVAVQEQRSRKRRKTIHGQAIVSPHSTPAKPVTPTQDQRRLEPFPQLPPLDDFPASRTHPRSLSSIKEATIIELDSDSDLEVLPSPVFKRPVGVSAQAQRRFAPFPSSSQESGLGSSQEFQRRAGFLSDGDDDVIDLT